MGKKTTGDLYIDIETYADTSVKSSGVYRYVEIPTFEIILIGYAFDDGPVHVTEDTRRFTDQILRNHAGAIIAHNANFERVCFSPDAREHRYLDPGQWVCTMAMAAHDGHPLGLKDAARSAGVDEKDTAGTRLINFWCSPGPDGNRRMPSSSPDKWREFREYCRQDVEVMRQLHRALPFVDLTEWRTDQRINDRGIKVDLELAKAAVEASERTVRKARKRLVREGVANPNSVQQIRARLAETGLELEDLTASTVEDLLENHPLTPVQREILESRQLTSSASVKKYQSVLDRVCSDGRLRGSFAYHGSHTGRWAGRGVQWQNLPRAHFDSPQETERRIARLKKTRRASPDTLKKLTRPMFVGPFTVADYSSIEAVIVAWLAGETWVVDAFKRGEDLYVAAAERLGSGMTRQHGKVATLALGYGGAVGALRVMGATGTDKELARLTQKWREANPYIAGFWGTLERAFVHGGQAGKHLRVDASERGVRRVILPSGRHMVYRGVGTSSQGLMHRHRSGRVTTWGGKLTENVTQAVARDVLASTLTRLEGDGYRVVGHVHDEIICERPATGMRKRVLMPPPWETSLPLRSSPVKWDRYGKD